MIFCPCEDSYSAVPVTCGGSSLSHCSKLLYICPHMSHLSHVKMNTASFFTNVSASIKPTDQSQVGKFHSRSYLVKNEASIATEGTPSPYAKAKAALSTFSSQSNNIVREQQLRILRTQSSLFPPNLYANEHRIQTIFTTWSTFRDKICLIKPFLCL